MENMNTSFIALISLFVTLALFSLAFALRKKALSEKSKTMDTVTSKPVLPDRLPEGIQEAYQSFWKELCGLPQFVETYEKTIINLTNGDEVYWSEYKGEPCIATSIGDNGVRLCSHRALSRYLDLQLLLAEQIRK